MNCTKLKYSIRIKTKMCGKIVCSDYCVSSVCRDFMLEIETIVPSKGICSRRNTRTPFSTTNY